MTAEAAGRCFSQKLLNIPGEIPMLGSLFHKVADLKACNSTLLKSGFITGVFLSILSNFLRTAFFIEHL